MKGKINFAVATFLILAVILGSTVLNVFLTKQVIIASENVRDVAASTLEAVHNMRFGILHIVATTNESLLIDASRRLEPTGMSALPAVEEKQQKRLKSGSNLYEDALAQFEKHNGSHQHRKSVV